MQRTHIPTTQPLRQVIAWNGRHRRKELDLSQERVSQRMSMSRETVRAIEPPPFLRQKREGVAGLYYAESAPREPEGSDGGREEGPSFGYAAAAPSAKSSELPGPTHDVSYTSRKPLPVMPSNETTALE
jgi:hypothetical protein